MISFITLALLSVTLIACSDQSEDSQKDTEDGWSESPAFELGDYEVIGKEERLAIDHIPFVAERMSIMSSTSGVTGRINEWPSEDRSFP